MNLKLDPETLPLVADLAAYRNFCQGTPFQQSMALLALLDRYLEAHQQELLAGLDLPPGQYQQAVAQLGTVRKSFLRVNPPPHIDPEALRLYCDQ